MGPGRLWDQDLPQLVANLGNAIGLRDAYVDAYRCATLALRAP